MGRHRISLRKGCGKQDAGRRFFCLLPQRGFSSLFDFSPSAPRAGLTQMSPCRASCSPSPRNHGAAEFSPPRKWRVRGANNSASAREPPRLSASKDLSGWASRPSPMLGGVGILTLTNVNHPTLTSNSTTLGWGTLEIPAGIKKLGSLDPFGWAARTLMKICGFRAPQSVRILC